MKINNFIFIQLILLLSACSDIFEEDLTKSKVNLIAPSNNITTNNINQVFQWETLDGAEYYNIKIVSKSFDSISSIILDSNIKTTSFIKTIDPGIYEWKVTAFNNSGKAFSDIYKLIINTTEDLTNLKINLISPSNYINHLSVTFRWNKLYNAEDYLIEIRNSNWTSGTTIHTQTTKNTQYNLKLENGTYSWGVKALNKSSETDYSTLSFTIDTIIPNIPILNLPADNAILTDSTISFSWNRGSTSGTTIKDSLFIYSDAGLLNIKQKLISTQTKYILNISTNGVYYWRVLSIDLAGNKSDYSSSFKFTMNQ